MKRIALAVLGTDALVGTSSEGNGPWFVRWLTSRGWSVETVQFIPETEADLQGFLRSWAGRLDSLVFACGGAVPRATTLLSVLADFLRVPFPTGEKMTDLARAGAEILSGPDAVAAGLRTAAGGSEVLILPGEPSLFRLLVQSEFEKGAIPGEPGFVRVVGRSVRQIRERLLQSPVGDGGRSLSMVSSPNVVTLIPQCPKRERQELLASLRALFAEDCLPPEADTLTRAVLAEAGRTGMTLAAAESCTGGLIGAELTEPAGASASFFGSAVCYSNEAKRDLLQVPWSVLETRGAVSEECAVAMSRGARRLYHADFAVSVTGIAGPEGGSPQKPVGTVWFGLSSKNGERAFMRCFRDMDRSGVRQWTVAVALESLWRCIRGGDVL